MDYAIQMVLLFFGLSLLMLSPIYLTRFIKKINAERKEEIRGNKIVDVGQLTIDSEDLQIAFKRISNYYTEREYKRTGKEIYTQKGEYRADFKKASSKYQTRIMHECLDGDYLSIDFQNYLSQSPNLRVRDLETVIVDYTNYRSDLMNRHFTDFMSQVNSITPEEFFALRPRMKGDAVGVYIIHNQTNGKYYVGQATRLFFRINQHFTGKGNGDVYADYKYGDDFAISIVKLSNSGYSDLDKLERDLIEKYDAYYSGYNKTNGNQ